MSHNLIIDNFQKKRVKMINWKEMGQMYFISNNEIARSLQTFYIDMHMTLDISHLK